MASGSILAKEVRRIVLEQSKRANVGHIGSALSIADIVAVLYGGAMRIDSPQEKDRDRFILSKGHAALSLYAALHLRGWLSKGDLDTFCGNASFLGVHPEHTLAGIDFSTGSLGQGLSIGAGVALASKLRSSSRRTFVLLSDAECNEGSCWEAITFAAHHALSNLVAIVDLNGQQAFGDTQDVLSMSPMAERWRAFKWDVHEVDGHDGEALLEAIESLDMSSGPPHVLIARTTFGKGVSYMERQLKWHYWPMSDIEYDNARAEVERA
ncbi:MAG: transketolase [Anaerolineae bacterium]|nr:transketolase [Gemmatimonadaceae bacterium]